MAQVFRLSGAAALKAKPFAHVKMCTVCPEEAQTGRNSFFCRLVGKNCCVASPPPGAPQDEDAEPRKLYYAPLTFLSHVGGHSIEWPLDLWQTFVSSSLGVSIPILVNHPRTLCACKKHLLGHLPDHVHCCQSVAASTQAHDCACQRRLQQAGGSSAAMSR